MKVAGESQTAPTGLQRIWILWVPRTSCLSATGPREMQLVAMEATVDHRVSYRDGDWLLEFSWSGFDEGDEVNGRGWARIEGELLRGELFIHQGDSSTFVAKRED